MQTFGQVWPNEWIQRFPQLQQIQIPTPTNNDDAFLWLGPNQVRQFFSVKVAWKTLEEIGPLHHWYKIVWNKAFIPKHALCMWMACLKRLPTQDRLNQWKNDPSDLKCVFCNMVIETHNHLFFECNYSGSIWNTIKQETGIQNSLNTLGGHSTFMEYGYLETLDHSSKISHFGHGLPYLVGEKSEIF